MSKILYISYFAPYDTVDHAGGKVHNFYLKRMHREVDFDITLLTMCYQREVEKLDLERYGIKHRLVVLDKNRLQRICRKFYSGFSYFNPWDKYNGVLLNYERYRLKKMIRKYAQENEPPDLIVLQWTQIILLTPYIRKWYPGVPIVSIEEDVLFLNFYRRISLAKGRIRKQIAEYQYRNMKKRELEALDFAQLAVVNNPKDGKLLVENKYSSEKLFVSSIYFEQYGTVERKPEPKQLLFYGAMHREENHLSIMWFLQHVMPLLPEEYYLVVAGSRPREELLRCQSDRVRVIGFVEDVSVCFEKCLCLVAPLVLGAGIKVKVLEAMSAGVPVLTNDVGIEGIHAEDGREYFHCTEPEDYVKAVLFLDGHAPEADEMGKRAKAYIRENYDLEQKYKELAVRMKRLVGSE